MIINKLKNITALLLSMLIIQTTPGSATALTLKEAESTAAYVFMPATIAEEISKKYSPKVQMATKIITRSTLLAQSVIASLSNADDMVVNKYNIAWVCIHACSVSKNIYDLATYKEKPITPWTQPSSQQAYSTSRLVGLTLLSFFKQKSAQYIINPKEVQTMNPVIAKINYSATLSMCQCIEKMTNEASIKGKLAWCAALLANFGLMNQDINNVYQNNPEIRADEERRKESHADACRQNNNDQQNMPDAIRNKSANLTILGLDAAATANDINKAYRRLALERHPDRNDNTPKATIAFQNLGKAYAELKLVYRIV